MAKEAKQPELHLATKAFYIVVLAACVAWLGILMYGVYTGVYLLPMRVLAITGIGALFAQFLMLSVKAFQARSKTR